jgi:hypothetical protein
MKQVHAITDHALLRWLDRVHGLEVEPLRAEMLAQVGPCLGAGARGVRIGDNWFVFNSIGDRVVSVMPYGVRRNPNHSARP